MFRFVSEKSCEKSLISRVCCSSKGAEGWVVMISGEIGVNLQGFRDTYTLLGGG